MTDQEKNDIDTERCFVLWVREMQKRIHQNAVEKGFWGENGSQNNIGEKIALVHSELSEALEALRTVGLNGKSEKVDGATFTGIQPERSRPLKSGTKPSGLAAAGNG